MKKEITWGTPKRIQAEQKRNNPKSRPAKKPRGYCIKLKGEHDFTYQVEREFYSHTPRFWYKMKGEEVGVCVTNRCVCGKKKVSWETTTFDKHLEKYGNAKKHTVTKKL